MSRIESLPNVPGIGVRHRLVREDGLRAGQRASADEAEPDTSGLGRFRWRFEAQQKVSGSASDRARMSIEGDTADRDSRRCLTPASLGPFSPRH